MGWLDKAVIAVSNIGKGLVVNPITKLLDVSISTDANNTIVYGSDNGVMVPDTITPHVNAVDPHPQYAPKTEPTNGFVDKTQTSISFNEVNRTFTISPTASSFEVYSNGQKYTKNSTEDLICSNSEGLHIIYYNDSGVLSESTSFDTNHIMRWAIVALYYWDVVNQKMVPGLQDERHGCQWPSSQHLLDHLAIGAEYESGLDISLNATGDGSSIDHIRFSSTSGYFQDEDLRHSVPTHLLTDNINYLYRTGSGLWKSILTSNLVYSIGTGRAAYNYFDGNTWSLAEVSNGNYVISYLFVYPAMNGLNWVCVPGTEIYNTKSTARAACLEHPNLGSLPAPEYKLIAAILIQTSNTYTNSVKSRIVTQDDGSSYIDWRRSVGTSGSMSSSGMVYSVNGYTGNVVLSNVDVGAQETLISGTNIKTINNNSILGSGNLDISAADRAYIAYQEYVPYMSTVTTIGTGLSVTGTGGTISFSPAHNVWNKPTYGYRQTTASTTVVVRVAANTACVVPMRFPTYYQSSAFLSDALAKIATHRFALGIIGNAPSTDVNPSTFLNCIMLAYDTADTTVQIMHNDSIGTCTKINTGWIKPTESTQYHYFLKLKTDPATGTVSYEARRWNSTDFNEDVFSGVINTNLPGSSIAVVFFSFASAGGTSSTAHIRMGQTVLKSWIE